MLEAAEVVREVGAEPVLLLPVVDRGGTVEAMAAEHGLPLIALVTAPDLGFPYEGPLEPLETIWGSAVAGCLETPPAVPGPLVGRRSEERRVGKEGGSTW